MNWLPDRLQHLGIFSFYQNLKVSQRLAVAIGAILTTMLCTGVYLGLQQIKTGNEVNALLKEYQPAVSTALELQIQIEQSSVALGYYLVGGEKAYLDGFDAKLKEAVSAMHALAALPVISADETLRSELALLQDKLDSFRNYSAVAKSLVKYPERNRPGLAFANREVGPVAERIRVAMVQMLTTEGEEDLSEHRVHILLEIAEMQNYWATITSALRAYLAFRNDGILSDIDLYVEQVEEKLHRLLEYEEELGFETQELILQLQQDVPLWRELEQQFVAIHSGERWRKDTYLVRNRIGPLRDEIGGHVAAIVDALNTRIHSRQDALLANLDRQIQVIIQVFLASLLIGIVIYLITVRLIVTPLRAASDAMLDVAEGEGNLSHQLDEIGNDEITDLARGFNGFVTKIKGVVDMVMMSATSLSTEASRMSEITGRSRQRVIEQQHKVNEINASMQVMSSSVAHVASNASSAAQETRKATSDAQDAQRVVTDSVQAMEQLSQTMSHATAAIERAETESRTIGEVLGVIREISEQTNLLALNAAIEAARAGENGRGFAVVADEVRTLSQRTQQQTGEIQSKIQQLQKETDDAVSAMAEGRTQTEKNVAMVEQANTALANISASIASISSMNDAIEKETESQHAQANDIQASVVEISDIAEETAQAATLASATGNEFSLMAGQLQGLVEKFLLEPTGTDTQRNVDNIVSDGGTTSDADDIELF